MMLKRLCLFLLLALATPVVAGSSATLPHTKVALVAETAAPAAGQRFAIALVLTPKAGWHTYYQHPGDTGLPPRAVWRLPLGASASAFRFPVPETFVVAGLMNHVYASRNVLLADIEVPATARGAFPLHASIDWLVCDDRLCVPEQAELSLPLTIGDGRADPAQKALFAAARHALPRALAEPAHFAITGQRLRLTVPFADPGAVTGAHFFAGRDDAVRFAAPQIVERGADSLIIDAEALPGATIDTLPGLLRIERGADVMGLQLVATPGVVPAGTPIARALPPTAFLGAFGFALLGGLLLNLMPCVFPILSLKALGIARSGASAHAARVEALAYTLGVLIVTLALGLAAILIAAAGKGAGWAFQLQDSRVILFLMLLTFAIGLNFAGLFEVNFATANIGSRLADRRGWSGAFFTGTLAAFVATPCTGPFMAGALGAALLLPPLAGLGVFAGLGLGLALPFLLVGFVPPLRRLLPRPGAWMVTFRHILAVPMLVTALGLAWILGRQAGADSLSAGLAAALLLALCLWLGGRLQQAARRPWWPMLAAMAVGIAAPLALGAVPAAPATAAPEANDALVFSAAGLDRLRAARQPTLLYFTADWCLTCKVNEKGALADPRVAAHFRARGIKVMIGDWTRPDDEIARFLAAHGRAGIPLYLFYGADGRITELPQLLTVARLVGLASPGSAGNN